LGMQTAFQTTAGLVAPFVMGAIIEHASVPDAGYRQGFLLAGLIAIAGGFVCAWLLRPERDVQRLGAPQATRGPAPAGAAAGGR